MKVYTSGAYFGELSLMRDEPRAATVRVYVERETFSWLYVEPFKQRRFSSTCCNNECGGAWGACVVQHMLVPHTKTQHCQTLPMLLPAPGACPVPRLRPECGSEALQEPDGAAAASPGQACGKVQMWSRA